MDSNESAIEDDSIDRVRRITWIGLLVNLFLSVLKFTVGYLGSSQAVIADAVHSLSDMATDLAVIFGVKYWLAPADVNHPYGHRRIETIITAAIGISLVIVAVGIGAKALASIREPQLAQPRSIALIGAVLSLILKEGLYHWTFSVGKRTKSPAVIANAWHHRSDALSSIPAIIAVTIAIMNPALAFIDHVGALVVSIFILRVSWNIIYPAFAELSDSGAAQKDLDRIASVANGIPGVQHVESIRTRRFGNGIHVDLHVQVEGEMSVRDGHDISGRVKRLLLDRGPDVLDVVVHIEPYEGLG
ncbi:MAG: cation diffusion facilitator family transporter [Desulfobacterales bacterium]